MHEFPGPWQTLFLRLLCSLRGHNKYMESLQAINLEVLAALAQQAIELAYPTQTLCVE